ncbi:small acid-soluble spore protein Tlp [Clostridium sp. DL1XJH146]
MKQNQDDRRDNVDRIQYNIDKTIQNYNLAEEAIETTSDAKNKKELEAKNERRKEALQGMKSEIKEEALAKKNGYK